MNQPAVYFYEFGPFQLYPAEHLLTCNGEAMPLPPKVFDILLLMVQNRGHLLEKDRMIETIWPDTCVEEGNLTRYISTLRQVLGERRNERQYISTAPKCGYRFIAAVREVRPEAQDDGANRSQAIQTIAVLPFKPLVREEGNESFALGLADTLIVRLSSRGRMGVAPISEVRRYADLDQNAVAAGRVLKVDAVLDGTFQQSGPRIRTSSRLVRTSDTATLWTGQFDEQFTDLFYVLDALANRITLSLAAKLGDQIGVV
ncbi:MAG: winged helix-turn-helix domain-containing protein [Blastocatellia bacterium]